MNQMRGHVAAETGDPELAWLAADGRAVIRVGAAHFAQLGAAAMVREGDLLVIADARIDNLEGLRGALGDLAPPDPAAGPPAHIAAAWRRWGRDCPEHLLGDYAFAVHDVAHGATFLARDHIGARPLAYSAQDARFAFASDPAELLALRGVSAQLDEAYVATALTRREFVPDRTFHLAVRKLPAGHWLHLRGGEMQLHRWWRPETVRVDESITDHEAIAETRRRLAVAVADRLHGAGRVAVHLSGGLDSALVAGLATSTLREQGHEAPLAYCWQPLDGPPANDLGWARSVGAALGLTLRSPRLTPPELAELLMADWTTAGDARYLIHEAAIQRAAEREGIDTILSGWGGDEGFSSHGLGLDPRLLLGGHWLALRREGGRSAFRNAAQRLAKDWLRPPRSTAALIARGKSLIDPAFASRTATLALPRIRQLGVQQTQIALLRHSSPTGRIEQWALSGAARGLTYGYPLLDRRLLEWVLTLPPRLFKRRGETRWLAREAARGLVPEAIRCNLDKSEAGRTGQLMDDLVAAYRLVAARLDDPAAPLTRARYVDVARLRRELAAIDTPEKTLGRGLRTAIQLLDFE